MRLNNFAKSVDANKPPSFSKTSFISIDIICLCAK
jgi:hypothetical protein